MMRPRMRPTSVVSVTAYRARKDGLWLAFTASGRANITCADLDTWWATDAMFMLRGMPEDWREHAEEFYATQREALDDFSPRAPE